MTISMERLASFETHGVSGMRRWLRTAAETYFVERRGRWAFEPFELLISTRDTLAGDINEGYHLLSVRGQADFRDALIGVLEELEPRPDLAELWQFLVELAWLLPAPGAVRVLDQRFTDDFFEALCANDGGLFTRIFLFVSNTAASGPAAERCVYRLVESNRFHFRGARHALLRLCTISPEHWTRHLALTRDGLHLMFERSDDLERVQEELAADIFRVIGFSRFHQGLTELRLAGDERSASDDWLLRALAERTRSVLVLRDPGGWRLAPAERPNGGLLVPSGVALTLPVRGIVHPSDSDDRRRAAERTLGPLVSAGGPLEGRAPP